MGLVMKKLKKAYAFFRLYWKQSDNILDENRNYFNEHFDP
jgi:hypothetical protein